MEDDGFPRGLSEADLEQSLTTLKAMAAEVHATCTQLRTLPGSSDRSCAVLRVHRICRNEVSYVDLRIAGEPPFVQTLCTGGAGKAVLDTRACEIIIGLDRAQGGAFHVGCQGSICKSVPQPRKNQSAGLGMLKGLRCWYWVFCARNCSVRCQDRQDQATLHT